MNPELPWDMISEVLFRTSLDTLDRCKMVSKEWKNMIYDSTFFPFYLEKSGTFFGFFIQDIYNNKNISMFVGINSTGEGCIINKSWPLGNIKILASSNQGIVCCEKRNDKNCRWYVGKPATEQWKVIPNPKLRYKTVGVALAVSKSKSLRFKIVRLSQMKIINDELKKEYACEIFDSKSWNWRKAQSTYLDYDESINIHQPAITIGRYVYWITYSNNILTFDISKQRFNKFSIPQIHVDAQKTTRLVEYKGGLGFSCLMPDGSVHLWRLTNFKDNYEWRKQMNVNIGVVEKAFTYPKLVGFCDSDTSFMVAYDGAIFFRKNGSFTSKDLDFNLRHANQFFQFCSDTERVNLRYVQDGVTKNNV